uniref:Uncharacterized protein n=1 Tax=Kalanchoe fedtschenkoi TaxID=63787 RepID=A0A7N0VIN2_KALFE
MGSLCSRFPLSGFRQASMFRILESKLKINSSSNEGSTLSSVKGKINFEHVSFKYSTRMCVQTVVPVGESGIGKLTMIS